MPRLVAIALNIPLRISEIMRNTIRVIPSTGITISCEKISNTFVPIIILSLPSDSTIIYSV
ncbi:conserved domain protein [Turicibacter sp. HGF1]|nr:conserved domain protein [Turicibacter sp. HGF1]